MNQDSDENTGNDDVGSPVRKDASSSSGSLNRDDDSDQHRNLDPQSSAATAVRKQSFAANFVSRMVYLRFPLLALLFLCLWSPISVGFQFTRPIAANILLIETPTQLYVLAIANVLAVVSVMAIYRVLNRRLASESNLTNKTGQWGWLQFLTSGLVSLICPCFALGYSHGQSSREFPVTLMVIALIVGITCGYAILYGFGLLRSILFGSETDDRNYFPFENRTKLRLLPSWNLWFAKQNNFIEPQLVLYVALLLCLFFLVLRPFENLFGPYFSVCTYVVLLTWIAAMILPGLSSVLDGWKLPTTLILCIWILGVRSCTHYQNVLPVITLESPATGATSDFGKYTNQLAINNQLTQPASIEKQKELLALREKVEEHAWQAINNRLSRPEVAKKNGGTLVVVTCPGGGIHATAWAAHVLEQLDRRYTDFSGSICVISSVSGGSVGTLFFVSSRFDVQGKSLDGKQWLKSVESSLEPVAAGFALEDVPAMFLPISGENDRGIRLENLWRQRLGPTEKRQTLNHWSQKAIDGTMPIVVFNATDAASGRRVLFSTIPSPQRNSMIKRLGRPWDIRELFPACSHDIHMASAARASATFPYVTPFIKPAMTVKTGEQLAIGDGGYADNEGIVTAVDWLDFIARRAAIDKSQSRTPPFKRILLLRIQPNSDAESVQNSGGFNPTELFAKVRWITGPLESLVSMRSASQVERGQLEVDLSANYIDSKWWGDENLEAGYETQMALEAGEANRASQELIYQRETVAQQEIKIGESKIGENAQSTGGEESNQESNDNNDDPRPQGFAGQAVSDWRQLPVIVLTLPFVSGDDLGDQIPLNWKLSEKQKQWYPRAWEELSGPKRTQFFTELDELFTLRNLD